MKKGFTFIELLAVIVILAIIALIATPIILGIINDARKESNEKSAELYASAVRNAIASYQLTHPTAPTSFSELDIEHDGNVVCEKEELYADGSFYIADCTVNGTEGTTAAPSNPSSVPPTGEIRYLGYDVTDGKVSAAYGCFTRNDVEYCLKGYDTNEEIIKDAYSDVLDDACSFDAGFSNCTADGLHVDAESNGFLQCVLDGVNCNVKSDGRFECLGY